jgi:SAM-dependent methyltransferase
VSAERVHEVQPSFPLTVYLCEACGHLQLLDVVSPEVLFREYTFETASSPGLVHHFRRHAGHVAERIGLRSDGLVVEVGSNDGSLLAEYKRMGVRVLGVDPARRIAASATERGIDTRCAFFSSQLARALRADHGPAALVEANNVYAHADDLVDLTEGVRDLLADDGVFVFEASYALDLIDSCLFDTIYHEHTSYHSVAPLVAMFERLGLELFDVERIATKGGSIRGYVQKRGGPRPVSDSVGETLALERSRGLADGSTYQRFAERLEVAKEVLHTSIAPFVARGEQVAGFGASVTVTTLIHHFELGGLIQYLVDDNPSKHGLYSPGLHRPVRSSEQLHGADPPGVVLLLAWQYAKPIVERHAKYAERGGRFFLPLPEPRFVERSVNSS